MVASADEMIEFQWAWAALVARRMKKVSKELLDIAVQIQGDGSRHEVVRSLLTYVVCRHGSAPKKKQIRDGYGASSLLVQLAILHASQFFTSGERSALIKTAEAHGDLQGLMCEALKAAKKGA
jgi:hypothetical protein